MKYRIDCVINFGLRYRVVLIIGRNEYVGQQTYADYTSATRAARKTGATPDERHV